SRTFSGRAEVLVVAVRPAEADSPRIPVVGAANAIDHGVGTAGVDVVAQRPSATEGEPGKANPRIGVVLIALVGVARIELALEAPGTATTDDQVHAIEVMGEVGG